MYHIFYGWTHISIIILEIELLMKAYIAKKWTAYINCSNTILLKKR